MLVALLLMCALIFCSGMLVLYRHALELKQMPDLFFREFSRVPADSFRGLRRWLRPLLGPALRPGDLVEVRNAAEIGATPTNEEDWLKLPLCRKCCFPAGESAGSLEGWTRSMTGGAAMRYAE